MQNLTEHFTDEELGVADCEQRLVNNASFLCQQLLEPIRNRWNHPVRVHDGYRDPGHNARVGGKQTSFHLFDNGKAAVDFDVVGVDLRETFDWIRLQSGLPFDKVILEFSGGHPACVHLQVDSQNKPRRQAFTGETGDGKNYVQVQVL